MANQEHVDILQQGVEEWNRWREQYPNEILNLSGADLSGVDLSYNNLMVANLSEANLRGANLSGINLGYADLSSADLEDAILSEADLSNANLRGAILNDIKFSNANLSNANFSETRVWATVFGDVDLRTVKGLETVRHEGPSTIGTNTLERSQGNIPEVFLRGAYSMIPSSSMHVH